MGTYEELKAAVASVIKTNGNQEITGLILQNSLTTLISQIGENATLRALQCLIPYRELPTKIFSIWQ